MDLDQLPPPSASFDLLLYEARWRSEEHTPLSPRPQERIVQREGQRVLLAASMDLELGPLTGILLRLAVEAAGLTRRLALDAGYGPSQAIEYTFPSMESTGYFCCQRLGDSPSLSHITAEIHPLLRYVHESLSEHEVFCAHGQASQQIQLHLAEGWGAWEYPASSANELAAVALACASACALDSFDLSLYFHPEERQS